MDSSSSDRHHFVKWSNRLWLTELQSAECRCSDCILMLRTEAMDQQPDE